MTGKQQEPPDPITSLAAGAAQTHELFMSWVNAGFTRPEALQMIIAFMIAATPRPDQQDSA